MKSLKLIPHKSEFRITLNFVDVSKRFVSGGRFEPRVVPGDVGAVIHDLLERQAEQDLVVGDPRRRVKVGQHRVVVHDNHDLESKRRE